MTQISAKDMIVGEFYRVVVASKHREYQVGDSIQMRADGSIDCLEAGGWMPACDVPAATEKMQCSVDHARKQRIRERLERQLEAIK